MQKNLDSFSLNEQWNFDFNSTWDIKDNHSEFLISGECINWKLLNLQKMSKLRDVDSMRTPTLKDVDFMRVYIQAQRCWFHFKNIKTLISELPVIVDFTTMYEHTIYGLYITNSESDQLPVGLIAQLVKHCTGIAEVLGSKPIQAWVLSRL